MAQGTTKRKKAPKTPKKSLKNDSAEKVRDPKRLRPVSRLNPSPNLQGIGKFGFMLTLPGYAGKEEPQTGSLFGVALADKVALIQGSHSAIIDHGQTFFLGKATELGGQMALFAMPKIEPPAEISIAAPLPPEGGVEIDEKSSYEPVMRDKAKGDRVVDGATMYYCRPKHSLTVPLDWDSQYVGIVISGEIYIRGHAEDPERESCYRRGMAFQFHPERLREGEQIEFLTKESDCRILAVA